MPSRTRRTCATKAQKENICVVKTSKSKESVKVAKSARKPLADKTNSASDDNASYLSSQKTVHSKEVVDVGNKNLKRPHRTRRVPTRYKENIVLNNLSVSHNVLLNSESPVNFDPLQKKSHVLNAVMEIRKTLASKKPEKKSSRVHKSTPMQKVQLEGPAQEPAYNLATNRPKRLCKLPSKFDDHTISPNKYIPVKPINASTPLAKKNKTNNSRNSKENVNTKNVEPHITPVNVSKKKVFIQKLARKDTKKGIASDTNNNGKQNEQQISPLKSPMKMLVTRPIGKKLLTTKNNSPKLLDSNKNLLKRDSSQLDVYEFIYDPDEEPQPAKKKKRKQTVRKPKPKTIRSTYEKNLAKALAALKNTVSSKISNMETVKKNEPADVIKNIDNKNDNCATSEHDTDLVKNVSIVHEKNYNSVRLEDIAKDIQPNEDDEAMDYSPINSPSHSNIHTDHHINESLPKQNNADPLNLQDDLSFFDDIPVASSSMNVSVRHPLASPWRVEFGNLPIKWQSNTYVKPNMTPAVESSFINFNDSKKKHVYTNMVPEANDSIAKVIDDPPNLIQTSIISFIKEVAEKQANKKNKKNITPVKANSLFEETTAISNNETPMKKSRTHKKKSETPDTEKEGEGMQLGIIAEANNNGNVKTPKALHKSADANNTYFGFDDIEDQENISPLKKNNRAKSLRSRTRGILQEINGHKGPTRAIITGESKVLKNKMSEKIKAVTEPQIFPEIAVTGNANISITEEPSLAENDDSQSVHLFEDIEFTHKKESCKSYMKAKKVTFHKKSLENSDESSVSDIDGKKHSEDEDNLDDISFRLPSERPKRTKKKKSKKELSKKEEKEVEAWAANFNSMCEDVEEFDLVVE